MASITIWTRLEPRTRELGMERSLQAQVRDPMWMLARQWQVGELLASDGGSPVVATIRTESVPLTSYRPGATGPAGPLPPTPPLEARVTAEPVTLGLRGAVQLGLRLEELLADEGVAQHAGAFREAWRVRPEVPPGELPDEQAQRFRLVAAGRVADGEALVAAARTTADLATLRPIPSLPTGDRTPSARAVARLVAHRDALFAPPTGAGAWNPLHLEYGFAVGAERPQGPVTLDAPRFGGEELDWYSFDLADGRLVAEGEAAEAEVTVREQAFIPSNVSFRGMPNSRWWSFEDGRTDFGRLDAEHVDLAKLVVMEFALVYGDDWFELPLPLPVGTLTTVDALVVTDTFGERILVRPTSEQVGDGGGAWTAFTLTGGARGRDPLLLAPRLGMVQEGPNLEDVLFLRDEMAAMGWAVERTLQGPMDTPVDGDETYRRRIAADPPPPPRPATPGGPEIEYVLGTEVPDNWIPLVPVRTSDRSFLFRRGVMGTPGALPARGRILEPEHPFHVADEAVSRAGVQVSRRFTRTRASDGSTWLWLRRRVRTGRGPGASGLAFDVVRRLSEPPPAP